VLVAVDEQAWSSTLDVANEPIEPNVNVIVSVVDVSW